MNYINIYNALIEKSNFENNKVDVYYEKHHILPKSLGGANTKDNLVKLTPRQHYIAHLLLYKIYKEKCIGGGDKTPYYKMLRALSAMVQFPATYDNGCAMRLFKYGSRNYNRWKEELAIINSECTKNLVKNRNFDEKLEISNKISTALKKKWASEIFPWTGKKHTQDSKDKMRKYKNEFHPQLGRKNSQYGTRCMFNEDLRKTIHVKLEDIQSYLANGWKLGAVYNWDRYFLAKTLDKSAEQNNKLSKSKSHLSHNQIKKKINNERVNSLIKEEKKKLYSLMYKVYCDGGFDAVKEKFNYKYTNVNFIQQCMRYVDDFIPQNGKKRGNVKKE